MLEGKKKVGNRNNDLYESLSIFTIATLGFKNPYDFH